MNRLSNERRALILSLLVDGAGVNATSRITGAAKNTVLSLLAEAGQFADVYQAYRFRDKLQCRRIEADEIWGFVGAREWNARQPDHGNIWLYTAIDPDTKLMVAWAVGDRTVDTTTELLAMLADRVVNRFELRTDGNVDYITAVRRVFGWRLDYAQLIKVFNPNDPSGKQKRRVMGNPDMSTLSTSIVERANLTIRTRMRRYVRKGIGYSRKAANHVHAADLHFLACNFIFTHATLNRRYGRPTTPAMAAGLASRPWTMRDVVDRMDDTVEIGVA